MQKTLNVMSTDHFHLHGCKNAIGKPRQFWGHLCHPVLYTILDIAKVRRWQIARGWWWLPLAAVSKQFGTRDAVFTLEVWQISSRVILHLYTEFYMLIHNNNISSKSSTKSKLTSALSPKNWEDEMAFALPNFFCASTLSETASSEDESKFFLFLPLTNWHKVYT